MPLVEAFGYTNVKVEGYEADDVIASLVRQAREEGIEVMVVTGDRDAYQLVGEGVRVMSTSRGITETKIYDRAAVEERYGVPPELITDLMGLRGDTSDNIPGVPGIGEKTATQLLQQFGSLEEVLASVDEISGAKRKQNLVEHADDARMSKQLATLQYDIETGVDLGAAMASRARPRRPARVHARVRAAGGAGAARRSAARGRGGARPQRRDRARGRGRGGHARRTSARGRLALAIDGDRWAAAEGERILAGSLDPRRAGGGARPARRFAAHDAKSLGGGRHGLLAAAAREGVELDARPRHDARRLPARAAAPHLRAGRAGRRRRHRPRRGRRRRPSGRGRRPAGARRGGRGRASTRPRKRAWSPPWPTSSGRGSRSSGWSTLLREVELPLVHVLAAMEREGLKLDAERLAEVGAGFGERIATLEKEIFELAEEEFTIGSPQQVGRILFEKLGLTRKRRGKTGFSTDARVLAQIRDEHPIVEKIESWRELTKLKNTYLDSLPDLIDPETGRVHTTFNQAATTTGRLSSTNPNLQNIPIRTEIGRPVRACFVAEQGARLLSADYSQVELRVLAHVADEEVLKEIFRAGEDVHAATAAEVFDISRDDVDVGQRSKAKMVNFGIVYGLTGFGLADRLNIPRKEGEEFVSRYLERFPAVRAFREQVVERAQEEGYVTTLMGRRRSIPELRSGNPNTRRLGERLAVNTVIQGTAADIIKVAMVRCQQALREAGTETRLVLQIHDELLFEGPPGEMDGAAELVRREMCAAYQLDPPLEVDVGVGQDWLDAK